VPLARAEMIRDRGGAALWEVPDGDHRLQLTPIRNSADAECPVASGPGSAPEGLLPRRRALPPGGGGRESGGEARGQRGPQDTDRGLRIFLSTGARVEGRCRFYSGPFFGSGLIDGPAPFERIKRTLWSG